jgi:hypothetical protein
MLTNTEQLGESSKQFAVSVYQTGSAVRAVRCRSRAFLEKGPIFLSGALQKRPIKRGLRELGSSGRKARPNYGV